MQPSYSVPVFTINPQSLSSLDKNALIDLLQHRTMLLLSASTLFVPDRDYIKVLIREVQEIQEEVKSRD